ncbi:hypothetical protein P167DRAFT_143742 [Morchella conica CCBAS932]|uniref:Uncharacterized protein n=1 Tax=Morchella conica CCBAS932 TaxID=1392247 RepID=A0A3N4KXN4_9PEZI|nr:hypothetical protein P167DRAFT_143742 [Morchella conica CCBAS932]
MLWTWSKKNNKSEVTSVKFFSDVTHEVWCDTNNTISVTPGTEVAKYLVIPVLRRRAVATVSWEIHMVLVSVNKGGLEIDLRLPPGKSEMFTFNGYQASWPWNGHKNEASNLCESLKAHVWKMDLEDMKKQLQSALGGTAKFILPGADNFLFKNAIFNNNGDVLLELGYNGVS